MDFLGIQGIINRINEIESKFQALEPSQPQALSSQSFQSILEQAVRPDTESASRVPRAGLVNFQGYPMTSGTAEAFSKLEALIRQRFPGKEITITSTVDGKHQDPNHCAGKAVDFVVQGITEEDSKVLEDLSRQAGFVPYNEYLHGSRFKSGNHMHVDLAG